MVTRGVLLSFLALIGGSAAGCLAPQVVDSSAHDAALGGAVVAMIESSFHVYHDAFRVTQERDAQLEAFAGAVGAVTLNVTYGDEFERNMAADDELWRGAETGQLYRVRGTNLFVYSVVRDGWLLGGGKPAEGLRPTGPHAAAVAHQLTASHPGNVVVMVQANTAPQSEAPGPTANRLVYPESFVDAFRWVRAQPWIDVLSVSVGNYFNPPDAPWAEDVTEIAEHTRAMVADGKLVVFGAGNFVGPPTLAGTSGVPWAVSVGGMATRNGTNDVFAAKLPDFVQNMYVVAPESGTMDGWARTGGTSFAAPAVAGRFAAAINALRAEARLELLAGGGAFVPAGALGPGSAAVGPWEVRSAFNVTAALWSGGEQAPPNLSGDPVELVLYALALGHPVPPGLESSVMGWGYVGDAETQAATALLLEYARTGDRALLQNPGGKGANTVFMESVFAVRQAWFDTVLPQAS